MEESNKKHTHSNHQHKRTQQTLRRERDRFLDHNDFAETLADRGVLRLTETIQVSSNKNFLSITFKSKEIMEAFCTEPSLVRDGI